MSHYSRLAGLTHAISLTALLAIVLIGCSPITYHDLKHKVQHSPRWTLKCTLDEVNWRTQASGDSARLSAIGSTTAQKEYYLQFTPQNSKWYYILCITVSRYDSTRTPPKFIPGYVLIDSLSLWVNDQALGPTLASLLQNRWIYSGLQYVSVEPLPLPDSTKSGVIRLALRVAESESSPTTDAVSLTLDIERIHKTRWFYTWP